MYNVFNQTRNQFEFIGGIKFSEGKTHSLQLNLINIVELTKEILLFHKNTVIPLQLKGKRNFKLYKHKHTKVFQIHSLHTLWSIYCGSLWSNSDE